MEHTFRTLRMVRVLDCDTGEHIIEDQRLKNLREECAKDDHYRNLIQVTTTGFPVKPDIFLPGVRPYWSIRDDLTVDDGIVLWGARMIIPNSKINADRDSSATTCVPSGPGENVTKSETDCLLAKYFQ